MTTDPVTVRVSPAEWWELQARSKDVQNAKLTLALAEQALAGYQVRMLQSRGLSPDPEYRVEIHAASVEDAQ